MTIVTDYRKKAVENTLCGAPLTRYRFAHWLCDVVRNFMSSPGNIRDERLRGLLWPQDGVEDDACRARFQVGLPLGSDTRKACVTPAILVSAGEQSYPTSFVNAGIDAPAALSGASAAHVGTAIRQVTGKVAVVTESLDGTLLLCDTIEDFLTVHQTELAYDGMLDQFNVAGSSEPSMVKMGEAMNAKDLVQSVISVHAAGGISWTVDTQGPVFRGARPEMLVE